MRIAMAFSCPSRRFWFASSLIAVLFGIWMVPAAFTAGISKDRPGPRTEEADAFEQALREARKRYGPRRAFTKRLYGIAFSAAFAPQIVVTKTDQIIGDDGDGRADPGETIRYTIIITNDAGAMDATGVVFTDTFDANTTLVAGSENASPLAFDAAANTTAGGVVTITLRGSDGDGDALTFSITNAPAAGTLGAITPLTPTTAEVTYTNTTTTVSSDSFTFKVNDGTVDSNEDGTVTISLANTAPVVTITDTSTLT